jgi:DNA replication and repair protein RecF
MKSALLSWKLAEAVFLESVACDIPVLLLDDVFSELDGRRSLRLLDLLLGFGQVILTTARDPDLPISEFQKISI